MSLEPNPRPLDDLEHWEEDLLRRYPDPRHDSKARATATEARAEDSFRDYAAETRPGVKEFYRLNHRFQTVDFVRQKREEYLPKQRKRMGIWEAMEFLNHLVDDSDPDLDLPQIEHLLQTAESIRADGKPGWFILTGLIHDLGKILCLWDEPQWAVVGDTFPVGCGFSPKIVFPEFFADNPDSANPTYRDRLGIYTQDCGLDQVMMSWGHDEYLYHVVKEYLPEPALYMIRYHSFYPEHRERAYDHLMNARDREMFGWVREFNPYDLYTKRDQRMDVASLRPFYDELIAEYFPPTLAW